MILLPVRNERHGGKSGPGYVQHASMKARNKALKYMEENFTIVEKPVTETGWKLGGERTLKI